MLCRVGLWEDIINLREGLYFSFFFLHSQNQFLKLTNSCCFHILFWGRVCSPLCVHTCVCLGACHVQARDHRVGWGLCECVCKTLSGLMLEEFIDSWSSCCLEWVTSPYPSFLGTQRLCRLEMLLGHFRSLAQVSSFPPFCNVFQKLREDHLVWIHQGCLEDQTKQRTHTQTHTPDRSRKKSDDNFENIFVTYLMLKESLAWA